MTGVTVVTGGGQGIGRAIVERLLADGGSVVVLELRPDDLDWLAAYGDRVEVVTGVAGEDGVATEAARRARLLGGLTGWVSNAALFRDAWLHEAGGAAVAELVRRNLQPALAGAAAAVTEFRAAGTAGSIVNVSSHQAQRPVRGALPYATAKAAVEGLTRALAVDYGPDGIRVTPSPWARSSPPAMPSCWRPSRSSGGPGSPTRSPSCTRWAGRGKPPRWRTWWPTCCRTRPATSPAR